MTGLPTSILAASLHAPATEALTDMIAVLAVCVAFGLVAQRLHQSVLVGYLVAGVLLGPGALGVVRDIRSVSFMGEVGVALLLFTIGLDLSWRKVQKVGRMAIIAGTAQVALTSIAASSVAYLLGASSSSSVVIGMAVSLSSTAVVMRVINDRAESDSIHGLVTTGVLLAQDLFVILMLVVVPLLPGASGAASGTRDALMALAGSLGQLLALVVTLVLIERVIMRRLFLGPALAAQRELLAVSSFVVSLGAIVACMAMGLSPALGGFIAGIVMADAAYASQVRSEIAPLRMGLVAVFFAYIGMLADLGWMVDHALAIAGTVALVIVGKVALARAAMVIARVPAAPALLTAVLLAQVGEFSFALLAAGQEFGLVAEDAFRLLIAVSLFTILATPVLAGAASRGRARAVLVAGRTIDPELETPEQSIDRHVIVVGMGPAGRSVVDAMASAGVPVTVIELNAQADTSAHEEIAPGTRTIFGDATRPEILLRAGLTTARLAVITVPEPTAIRTIIQQATQLAGHVPVIARGRYNIYVGDLLDAGADAVVDEEAVVGRELAGTALLRLGSD